MSTTTAAKTAATAKKTAAKPSKTPAPAKPAAGGPYAVGNLYPVPPGQLLLERNIRDSEADPALVASVRDVGVLQPITAALNGDGALVVRFGHRRTLAAVLAGTETVPVYVAGTDDLETGTEVARIVGQRDENTLRAGLTAGEEISSFEQLVAFGLTADQIASTARVDRGVVDTALKVSGSKIARASADKYESLTLDQAAVVAEFDHDPDIVKELVVTAVQEPGQFAHVAQRHRDNLERENARQVLLAELGQAGVVVLKEAPSYDGKPKALHRLADDKGKQLTEANHRKCPGHAAYLELGWERERVEDRAIQQYSVGYACKDPKKHGHVDRWNSGAPAKAKAADMSDAEREKAKGERKLVIDNNKAWDSAQVVRRAWLTEFAARKTAPKGTAAFIAAALAEDYRVLAGDMRTDQMQLCADWGLTMKAGLYGSQRVTLPAGTTDSRALVIALVQVLAGHEAAMDRMDWRRNGKTERHGRYLTFLQATGYELSDVEKFALSTKTV